MFISVKGRHWKLLGEKKSTKYKCFGRPSVSEIIIWSFGNHNLKRRFFGSKKVILYEDLVLETSWRKPSSGSSRRIPSFGSSIQRSSFGWSRSWPSFGFSIREENDFFRVFYTRREDLLSGLLWDDHFLVFFYGKPYLWSSSMRRLFFVLLREVFLVFFLPIFF